VGVDPLVPQISNAGPPLLLSRARGHGFNRCVVTSSRATDSFQCATSRRSSRTTRTRYSTGDKPKPSSPPVSRTPKLGGQTKKLNIYRGKSLSIASSRHLAANSNKGGHIKTEFGHMCNRDRTAASPVSPITTVMVHILQVRLPELRGTRHSHEPRRNPRWSDPSPIIGFQITPPGLRPSNFNPVVLNPKAKAREVTR
jgi:hypothetical protein